MRRLPFGGRTAEWSGRRTVEANARTGTVPRNGQAGGSGDSVNESSIQAIHRELGVPEDYGRRTGLPLQAIPDELVSIGDDVSGRERFLTPDAASALAEMIANAAVDGVVLQVVSAFRSVEYQVRLIERKLAEGQTIDEITRVVAAPGFSEHHSGCAVDLTTPGTQPVEQEFEGTDAFAWLRAHASRFGFVLSYPRDNPYGVIYEPWHWRYRGG